MPIIKHLMLFAIALTVLLFLTCGSLANIKAADIGFTTVKLVDYHDQQELPAQRNAGLEELIGRTQADQVSAVVRPEAPSERPHRLLLRVDLDSSVDFQAIANRNATVFLHFYFCSHQHDFAILSFPTVYLDGKPIRADNSADQSTSRTPAQSFKYYFYLNAERKESRNSKPQQMGFDLRVTPENVCFYVTGSGASGLIYTSTIAVVPKEAIVAAISQLAPD
jgi:hypothetical protein